MRVRVIDEICDYIRFLSDAYGLEITVHPLMWNDYLMNTRIVEFNSHSNYYCQQIKLLGESNDMCIQEQHNAFRHCKANNCFKYTCFAGVTQYIYPMYDATSLVGYIAVGSFVDDADKAKQLISDMCQKYGFKRETMSIFYDKAITPPKYDEKFITTVISPLCAMIELAYHQNNNLWIGDSDESFYLKILAYIKTRYVGKISLDKMCQYLNCSRSYISHFFKKESGMSIPEYVNTLRIRDAKVYLETTSMSIHEIAAAVGFSNSNYFSTVFKSITGITPVEYRQDCE